MSTGFWINNDGLPLQFGTQKAIPEVGGDYLIYGETREIEQLIALVPCTWGSGNIQLPAAPTSFVGTGLPSAAGIQSMTTLFPLQITPVTTVSGGVITFTTTQLMIESVSVMPLIGAVGGTSLAVGLAFINPATSAFVQVTPNAGTQLIGSTAFVTASMANAGQQTTWYRAGTTTDSVPASVAGGGDWLSNAVTTGVPLVTNAVTPLPTDAFISSIATGTFTNGLLKLRVRYTLFGNISY